MSSPTDADEEDVEFVSEGPLRPVLDCIDLLSDCEEEGSSSMANTIEDQIEREKAHAVSTLDRLARRVDVEKRERADKCRAFREKLISQKVRGQQEAGLANGSNHDAKRCVEMWLKMPGLRPGVINTGYGGRHRPPSLPSGSSTTHTCPVINCGRVYDGRPFLEGHLKRFDHSPCDPTITLKGCLSEIFACVACCHQFETEESWRLHLQSKVSSPDAEGHASTQTCQMIVCFACPSCFLLFSIRDECLQHMSAKNHSSEAITMNGRALPVPIPQYAKNRLIALCKDVPFSVRCSLCRKVLSSHQMAQAHFNVQCRQGSAVAEADRTVAQVMKQLQARGQCSLCCKIFLSQVEIEKHKESTQHEVEVNRTIERAILQYCHFSEIQLAKRAKETRETRESTGPAIPFQQRNAKRSHSVGSPAKRQKLGPSVKGNPGRNSGSTLAWFCECGLRFSEEDTASEHLFAVNQIFHQCGVCGKLMGEPSITRLHMSRFHGGSHLSNFLYHCRLCKVDMPRREDILLHVSEAHGGHTYLMEREVPYEPAAVPDAKPSMDSRPTQSTDSSVPTAWSATAVAPSSAPQWMCRMCEDLFDSEDAVHKHCSDLSKHSFQRFICGHCPQRFFKQATLRMHCMNEHGGQVGVSHFCGLCDSMPFDSEGEFLEHFKSLHTRDYYCVGDGKSDTPVIAEDSSQLPSSSKGSDGSCPCKVSEKSKEERRATYGQCMRNLDAEGKCRYVCAPCGISVSSFALIKTHVHTTHPALNLEKTFDVECRACQENFPSVPAFHRHHHTQHCPLEPCLSTDERRQKPVPTAAMTLDAVEVKPDVDGIEDNELAKVLNMDKGDTVSDTHEDESDEEMRRALALSAEEAAKESTGVDD